MRIKKFESDIWESLRWELWTKFDHLLLPKLNKEKINLLFFPTETDFTEFRNQSHSLFILSHLFHSDAWLLHIWLFHWINSVLINISLFSPPASGRRPSQVPDGNAPRLQPGLATSPSPAHCPVTVQWQQVSLAALQPESQERPQWEHEPWAALAIRPVGDGRAAGGSAPTNSSFSEASVPS